jgi:hypothetical protein
MANYKCPTCNKPFYNYLMWLFVSTTYRIAVGKNPNKYRGKCKSCGT